MSHTAVPSKLRESVEREAERHAAHGDAEEAAKASSSASALTVSDAQQRESKQQQSQQQERNQEDTPRMKVAVIYGGRSSEHSVSCVSAGTVIDGLDPQRYEVFPVGITQEGRWVVGEHDTSKLRIVDKVMPTVGEGPEVWLAVNPANKGQFRLADGSLYVQADVIFPVLHGRFGEDGTIQGLFELSGVPYVGDSVLASACAMDKEYTKKLLRAEGLPVGTEVVLRDGETTLTDEQRELLGLPVFVKPARGGSSVGISKVKAWDELEAAIVLAREHDAKVIVEAELRGAEIECGIIEDAEGNITASVPAQLEDTEAGEEGFYGFDTKYLDDVASSLVPAPLPPDVTEEIRQLSIRAFRALDCTGLARVDFFVSEDGPVLNEVNTLPGLTPISMYPVVLQASGMELPEVFDTLIDEALARATR